MFSFKRLLKISTSLLNTKSNVDLMSSFFFGDECSIARRRETSSGDGRKMRSDGVGDGVGGEAWRAEVRDVGLSGDG